MVKSKIALIIDSLFISFIISTTSFIWFRKIIKSANLVYFVMILIHILSFLLILKLFFKSNNKKIFNKDNETFLTNCLNYLIISPQSKYQNFLCKLLNCKHIEKFLYKLDDNFLYINIKTELSSLDFFEAQELLIKHSISTTKLYFIYKSKNKSFDEIISLSNIEIIPLTHESLLNVMSKKNIFPINKTTNTKTSLRNRLVNKIKSKSLIITSKHFKEFFFSGISLLFLSLIVPFSNYYLITGSILLLLSIIALFRKNYNPANTNYSDILFKDK